MCAITVNISSTIIRIVLQTTFEMESTENKLTQTNTKTNDQTDVRGKEKNAPDESIQRTRATRMMAEKERAKGDITRNQMATNKTRFQTI